MAFHSVLAAADFRRHPDPAVENGARLAAAVGARLHVLLCVRDPVGAGDGRAAFKAVIPADAGLSVEQGEPHELITAHASTITADVVVLGPRVERSLPAGLLGSTAERVISASRRPCLLSNAPLPAKLSRILLAMDRSVPARAAFDVTARLTQALTRDGRNAPVIHLVTISAFAQPGRLAAKLVDIGKYAERLAARAPAATVSHGVHAAPLPADGILSSLDAFGPALLVMGTHGSGALGRLVMGSVAQAVAREASVPLLLVPPKRRRKEATDGV